MKVVVKGQLRDLLAFFMLRRERKRRFRRATPRQIEVGAMNVLAARLHPRALHLVVLEVRDETEDAKTFRLGRADGGSLPNFRPGQYISLKVSVDGISVTRPYSLSSAPADAVGSGFYEITIRRKEGGFFTPLVWETWEKGTAVTSSGPLGAFYYEPLRDGHDLIFIAGGCGITPYRSLVPGILDAHPSTCIKLFYGITDPSDVLFKEYFDDLADRSEGRFSVTYVNSGEAKPDWKCEAGLITRGVVLRSIENYSGHTFFACGPEGMYHHLRQEFTDLPPGRFRIEAPGDSRDVIAREDYPTGTDGSSFGIEVLVGGQSRTVDGLANETVLVAIERAGLAPPSECRSGECGYCRSKLVSGEIYVISENDGRRLADRKFGFFHPCSSYPLTDLKISVP
jgi:glycine betaine catabolism B